MSAAGRPREGPLPATGDAGRRELLAVERLQRSLRGSRALRRMFHACSLVFPSAVALLLSFLALYPMLFLPAERLSTVLTSMLGAGLSFASVAFTAARANAEHRSHAIRFVTAGSMLLRFAIATAVALALTSTRERLAADFGARSVFDLPLRAFTALVAVNGIGMAFHGLRTLVMLLGPDLEEEATARLHALLSERSEASRHD